MPSRARAARAVDELHAELEQQREAEGLEQELEDQQPLDHGLRQKPGLDRDEQVAPLHEPVDDSKAREPGERSRQRKLRSSPALERNGQSHHEEDLAIHR